MYIAQQPLGDCSTEIERTGRCLPAGTAAAQRAGAISCCYAFARVLLTCWAAATAEPPEVAATARAAVMAPAAAPAAADAVVLSYAGSSDSNFALRTIIGRPYTSLPSITPQQCSTSLCLASITHAWPELWQRLKDPFFSSCTLLCRHKGTCT
eukprot:GHRQ01030435.1.p1 GENE.GHRQ01030435.1~~GHRQ01030435.1.p1  ORF type:complete len:153 (+),score=38.71 GHRQ01030435.1:138-596(+)